MVRRHLFAAAASVCPLLVACTQEPGDPSKADQALDEIRRLYDEAKDMAPDDPVEWAREDILRAGDWQYRVVQLEGPDAETLETQLNAIGEDRWEAFWVERAGPDLTILLKRPARSYLRSVPLSDIGRAVSGGDRQHVLTGDE